MKVDLNSDLGESFGHYVLGNDEQILPLITAANVACGFHAGDPNVMAQTVAIAEKMAWLSVPIPVIQTGLALVVGTWTCSWKTWRT